MALIYQPSKRIFCGWFEPLKSTTYSEYPQKVEAIVKLERETTRFIQASPLLKGVYSPELVQTIFMRPYCRIAALTESGIAKRQTAMKYLNLLTQAGILHSAAAGREKLFINSRLMALLKSDLHEYPPLETV